MGGAVAREVNGGRAYLFPVIKRRTLLVGRRDGDKLILHIRLFGIRAWHQVDDTHRLSRSRRQHGDALVAELLYSIDELLNLGLGEGLRLPVVVHEVVHAGGNEVLDQRIHL